MSPCFLPLSSQRVCRYWDLGPYLHHPHRPHSTLPTTTHAPHVPHPLSARLPIGVGDSNTSCSGSLPSSFSSTLSSRLNTVSPPPTPTSPILRSTSPPISGSVFRTRLRHSPLLGTTPLPGNRSSSTHAGGILPPASFFRPTGSNSAGRARGQSITFPASPRWIRRSSLPFKSTSSPSGEDVSSAYNDGRTPIRKEVTYWRSTREQHRIVIESSITSLFWEFECSGTYFGYHSFERLFWKRGSGAGGDGGNDAHRDEEAEVGSIGKRSSKRISVDDLGDGPSGGGVVMEMGGIAEFSQLKVGEGWKERNWSRVEDVHEDEKEIDAEGHVRERRNSFLKREQTGQVGFAPSSNYQRQQGSQGDFLDVDTTVEPEPHTATTDAMNYGCHDGECPQAADTED
ncbi:hypothetical protein FRC02_003329 [Tulasnella sp. 418]|nr:hypothetical protein FRC02_003329 [Tulasnella sp. 418]